MSRPARRAPGCRQAAITRANARPIFGDVAVDLLAVQARTS
jgi:hypothetical protein